MTISQAALQRSDFSTVKHLIVIEGEGCRKRKGLKRNRPEEELIMTG